MEVRIKVTDTVELPLTQENFPELHAFVMDEEIFIITQWFPNYMTALELYSIAGIERIKFDREEAANKLVKRVKALKVEAVLV